MAIRIPLGLRVVIARRKGETDSHVGLRPPRNDGGGVGGLRRFVVRTVPKAARWVESTPLAPLLGELSSVSETEGSPGLRECQWGKELSGWFLSFPVCTATYLGDPLPQCAHWGLPLKGAALRGVGLAPLKGELSPQVTEGYKYLHTITQTSASDSVTRP